MKSYIIAALFGLALTSTAGSEGNQDRLAQSLLVEWIIANCEPPESIGLTMIAASMIINGSDPVEVDEIRTIVRNGLNDNYPSTEAACTELMASMK